jgi:hypothetical protein
MASRRTLLRGFALWPIVALARRERAGSTEPAAIASNLAAGPIRAGMIGLDTSHVVAFTKVFNDPRNDSETSGPLGRVRIVAGYPGGTDLAVSRDRVEGFTEQLRGLDVAIVDSIPALLEQVDVVLLESVDGRVHFEQAVPVILAGKPLFIDKPVACSLVDAIAIYDLAERHRVPVFSSSALRFNPAVDGLARDPALGRIVGAVTWGPCVFQPGVPDLFYYGIHGVEMLYRLLGPGCESVVRIGADDTDVITGRWSDGRLGSYRGIRTHHAEFGAVAFGTTGIRPADPPGRGYREICDQIARFFDRGTPPVSAAETIEIIAFLEAAEASTQTGGLPVAIGPLIETARTKAATKLAELPAAHGEPPGTVVP